MMIGQAKTIIKQYFTFSRQERKGIILLLALLLLLLLVRLSIKWVLRPQPLQLTFTELPPLPAHQGADTQIPESSDLFTFDPNTASDEELKSLGFTEKNVLSLRKYQSKGGKLRKPADLLKLYGLSDELKQTLLPFVVIATPHLPGDSTRSKTQKPAKVVELNKADSSELVALYRIGPATAGRIVEYRNKLGGFLKMEQLTELWGFDEDILYDLEGRISLDPTVARIFDLNTVTLEELKTHPYFKYKLSHAIVNYRQHHGPFKQMEELKNIVLVNDSVYQKITMYLRVN